MIIRGSFLLQVGATKIPYSGKVTGGVLEASMLPLGHTNLMHPLCTELLLLSRGIVVV